MPREPLPPPPTLARLRLVLERFVRLVRQGLVEFSALVVVSERRLLRTNISPLAGTAIAVNPCGLPFVSTLPPFFGAIWRVLALSAVAASLGSCSATPTELPFSNQMPEKVLSKDEVQSAVSAMMAQRGRPQ